MSRLKQRKAPIGKPCESIAIRGVWLSSSARRRAHNDVIGHQVDDGALPDQTEDTHGTTTDTDDTIGSLQRKGGAFRTGSYRVEKGLSSPGTRQRRW